MIWPGLALIRTAARVAATTAGRWWRPAALALALAAAFGAGWRVQSWRQQAAQSADQVAAAEATAESQRLAARHHANITQRLTADRIRTERTAAAVSERLRQLAQAPAGPASTPACPGGNDDPGPAVRLLPGRTRSDLVRLAAEADAVADRLRACQALVVAPGGVEEKL